MDDVDNACAARGASAAARAAQALFSVPTDRFDDYLGRLPPGTLWRTVVPGTDPAVALLTMGDGAGGALLAAASAFLASGALPPDAGLPLPLGGWPHPASLASALLADASAASLPPPPEPRDDGVSPGGVPWEGALPSWMPFLPGATEVFLDASAWRVEMVHRTRERWLEDAGRCFMHAASAARDGFPDPLDSLVACPSADLRGAVPFADAATRLRFAEALDRVGGDPGRTCPGYFRRSCVEGVVHAAGEALAALPGGWTGRHPDGWPAWWRGVSADPAAFSRLPPGIGRSSAAVRLGIPSGWTP